MRPDEKKQRKHDVRSIAMMLLALVFTCRLWPILLLMMLGVFYYAIWALIHIDRQPAVMVPAPPLALPAPVSEQDVVNTAFGLLQRRITESLTAEYPQGKWVWSQPGACERFAAGAPLTILLADAGGYHSASVITQSLKFCGLQYHPRPGVPVKPGAVPDAEAQTDDTGHDGSNEAESTDYGLLAFEWVDANLPRLNQLANEAVAQDLDVFHIPSAELPHGDSWCAICDELVQNGFRSAKALADGIQVEIKI